LGRVSYIHSPQEAFSRSQDPVIQVQPVVEQPEPIHNVDDDNDYTLEVLPEDEEDDGVSGGDPLKCVEESGGGSEELTEETFPHEEEDVIIMDYDLGNAETERMDLNILSVDGNNVVLGGQQRDGSNNVEQSARKVKEESHLVETTEEGNNSSTSTTTSSLVNHTDDEQLPLEAAIKLTSKDNNIAEQSTPLLIENGLVAELGIEAAGRNVRENEDGGEDRSDGNPAVIHDVQKDLATTGNAAGQPGDDEGPPHNAEIPSLPCMGRKTSRKAQLATEVRMEGHNIEFEEYVTVVPADSPLNNLQVSGVRERKRKFDSEFLSTEDHVKCSSGSAAAQRLSSVFRLEDDLAAESSSLEPLKMKPRKKKSKKGTFPRRNAPQRRNSNKPDPPLPAGGQMKVTTIDTCAMCREGGEEVLICCDRCPNVFHLKCHAPSLEHFPPDDWQCTWCRSLDEIMELQPKEGVVKGKKGLMAEDPGKFLLACKFLSEVYKIEEGGMMVRMKSVGQGKVSGK
jgi:hypothetical protein